MRTAHTIPCTSRSGVTAKAKVTWLKLLPVHRGGVEAVEGEIGQYRAEGAADDRQRQRLDHHRDHDRAAAEAQGAQGGDLARARRDGAVHGVERAEDGADGHQGGDQVAQGGDEPGHRGGLLGVILGLAEHLHVQARVGGQRVLELLERARARASLT